MSGSQKKLVIITASVILHAVTLYVIFVLYHQPSHDLFADFDPSKAIDVTETVFYDPPPQQSQSLAQSELDQEWGQLKPRASTLADSMEMPDGPIGVEQPGQNSDESTTVSEDTQENGDDVGAPADTPHSLEFNPQIKFENEEDKQYLANIARMGDGGEYEVEIKNAQGDEQIKKLSEVRNIKFFFCEW